MLNGLVIDEYGCHRYYKDDKIHRDDGPAIILPAGSQKFFIEGKLHNEYGPAVVSYLGMREYYIDGRRHRENGPAVIEGNGTTRWFWYDLLHRLDGPAIEFPNGMRIWSLYGDIVNENIVKFYNKNNIIKTRERRILFEYFDRWKSYMDDPNTEVGQRFMEKKYLELKKL